MPQHPQYPESDRQKYPVVVGESVLPQVIAKDKPKVAVPELKPRQKYPESTPQPFVPKSSEAPKLTAAAHNHITVPATPAPAPAPVIKGAWIVQADEKEYEYVNVSGMSEFAGTKRTKTHLYFYTSDYKNEKQVKSAYARIKGENIPSKKIVGYLREIEAKKEGENAQHNLNVFMYDGQGKLTPYGMIIQRIEKVSSTWKDNDLTSKKVEILENFREYYYKHSKAGENIPTIQIITKWVAEYKANHQDSSPLVALGLGRLNDCRISMFNGMSIFNKAGNTESLQLFEKITLPTDKAELKKLMDNELGVTPSCFDGVTKSFSSCFSRMTSSFS